MNGSCSTTRRKSLERLPDAAQLETQWKSINWKKAEAEVNRLQARIAKATQEKKWNTVKRLQYLLTHSYYAKALAVRKVTTNKGKNTPGVDKEVWSTPSSKMRGALTLTDKRYKAKVVNVKRRYSDFLGFKIKVTKKAGKAVVKSHISDKQLSRKRQNLLEQAKRIARPRPGKTEFDEVNLYNFMVMGMQNYYRIATDISRDCNSLNRSVMTILTNRLRTPSGNRLVKTGRTLTNFEKTAYGKARTMRYVAGTGEPIYPISYVQHRKPMSKKLSVNSYSPDGRQGLHDNLRINTSMMLMLMRQPLHNRSIEYADNRISLYSAQWGKCAITGHEFRSVAEIHCHHATPRSKGGTDKYENLVLILESVHRLIHATRPETINHYKEICNLNVSQMKKLNEFRQKAGLESIA